ncbi:hypothetical protein AQUCO_01600137v1 [Aquilegia coerulea]|uniref:Dicer-like protein 4 n=1 Tax=Aquilegia coerulea TaxID=218851 RepID=A0A2G5DR27_AQUCA|nr:hypothetical protein AQUCO_01600137v1 [Aquilegia coerulea]
MAVEEEKESSIHQMNHLTRCLSCMAIEEEKKKLKDENDGRIEVEMIQKDSELVDEVGRSSSSTSSSTDILIVTNSTVDQEEEEEKSLSDQNNIKDPRIRARKYQLDLCKKAVDENIIVYLGTGCGKTHIAVLLIYELGHLIRKPQKSVCVFLAPTIPLVRQQAAVIEESTNFKVGSYYGHSKYSTDHLEWEKELDKYEVLVMTPQILLHNLLHRLIKMELIALLIFDECHHAQAQSSHPYAQIMKEYNMNSTKRPRVFGMTASPIVGKGGDVPDNVPRGINTLEKVLNAKVYSVEDNGEVERFVASPKVKCYYYDPISDCTFHKVYLGKLEELKNQCIEALTRTTNDVKVLRNSTKLLLRLQDNLLYCLENLGLWGAVQAVRILLNGDQCEDIDIIEAEGDLTDNSLANQYLSLVATVVDSDFIRDGVGFDSSILEALKDPIFSKKLLVLIHILSSCRIQQDIKCIVFVNRIIVARTLSYILMNLKCLPFWKCHFLVGYHSGLKNMSRKNMNSIIEKFRSGELNLLVATSVGEEGLDIQTCCLVIRFDLPNSVASFIQSKGRARMPESEYAFLVERKNQNELNLIETFLSEEDRMNEEITCRTSRETYDVLEESNYRVPSTGASISATYSVSLLHRYCSKLPRDEYFIPKLEFFFFDDNEGVFCRVVLPSNAPIHQVDSPPQSSKEKAKKIACLRACKELHLLGALTDNLLPVQDDKLNEESTESDSCEDDSSRGELHEMLSPSVLKTPWNSENSLRLNFYFIEFVPVPNDRLYQKFGLFVKTPLPTEARTMELDLHLAHGRIVKTKLVPLGVIDCNADEIAQAKMFQELYLKIILDRKEFFADFVPLGKKDLIQPKPSTSYLLLPVRQNKHEPKLAVDWELIKRCLSSPVFGAQKIALDSGGKPIILADGPANTSDVVNSLIFTPHNKLFFFVDGILSGIDASSPFTDNSSANYVDHYAQKFSVNILHPKQPLLKAKQLFSLHNLLHNRVQGNTGARELEEHFVELPPELCSLKILGFSKDIGSSLSLLPSLMHRLENLLVAIELKSVFSNSFVEGSQVTAHRVLEAVTTEKCMERFSLERLEVLGDAFLKYAVGRHVFLSNETIDEGQLTRRRSSIVNNGHLYKLAIRSNLQVYIRDENFDPSQFFAMGRPCKVICNKNTEMSIHFQKRTEGVPNGADSSSVKCSKGHHWLHRKTVADIVEALVGAFIVDSGFKAAIAFLKWVGIEVDFEASQVSSICMASNSYMSLINNLDTSALEKSLGYRFVHKGLLVQAFLHPSYNKHSGGCYQRLEFLGDAVLDYLITSYLFSVYPKLKPGQLTDLRSVTVNNNAFARVAVCRSFHTYLISDSEALSEAVQKFVSLSHTSPAEEDMIERPTCPKVHKFLF